MEAAAFRRFRNLLPTQVSKIFRIYFKNIKNFVFFTFMLENADEKRLLGQFIFKAVP